MLRNTIILLLLVLTTISFAQRRNQKTVTERVAHLSKALDLNADQKEKVKIILEDSEKIAKDLRVNKSGGNQQNFKLMEKMRQDVDKKIIAILNEEQVKKYKKFVEENRKQRPQRERRKGGRRNSTF